MNNTQYTEALKGFDFSAWGGIEGFLRASKTGQTGNFAALIRLVPDLAKAVDMTATAVAAMPFEFQNDDGSVSDSSSDWQNALGGLPNPQRLVYLLAASLCGGEAYVLPFRTPKAVVDLQYLAPATIEPYIDINGLQYFSRTTQQGKSDNYIKPTEILYFWLPDSNVEVGPAENNPIANALQDAQAVYSLKNTIRIYGERGFVPITLLGAKGMPNPAEREKSEKFFDRLLRGGFDVLAKIFNADSLEIKRLGAGMEELKQSYKELRDDAKTSIADSFGIPTALFMADQAYASEFNALRRQWYTSGRLVSIYQTIEEVMTSQLLAAYKKRMRFNPQAMEVFQEHEANTAAALSTFVSAVSADPRTAKLGMGILHYDLTDEQAAELDAMIAKKEKEPDAPPPVDENAEPEETEEEEPATDNPPEVEEEEPTTDEPPAPKSLGLSADDIKDLALWCEKARAWQAKGKSSAVDWENKHLSETIAAPIRLKLAQAQTEADITAAFDFTASPVYHSQTYKLDGSDELNAQTEALKSLAASIEKAIAEIKE